MPTEKAHGVQICKMCEEFSLRSNEVELIAPKRENNIKEDIFSFYNLERNFQIRYIDSIDLIKNEKLNKKWSFYIQNFVYLLKLFFLDLDKDGVIYTRSAEIVWLFSQRGYKVVFEAHNWPESKVDIYRFFLKNAELIICNSKGTEKKHRENGFKDTLVASNGVDIDKYNIKENKEELRKELGLPVDKKIIMYVGHLYKWKGSEVMMEAAKKIKDDFLFVLIGGTEKDLEKYQERKKKENIRNIIFLGHQLKIKIPKFMKSADVLLLPNVSSTKESVDFTSPIKMFEYMASQKPIIASDLPSIKEVLDEKNAIFFREGDSDDLVKKIDLVFSDEKLSEEKSEKAFQDVQKFTWAKRAEKILNLINNL